MVVAKGEAFSLDIPGSQEERVLIQTTHRENRDEVHHTGVGSQGISEHADRVMMQVVEGADAAEGERLNGTIILDGKENQKLKSHQTFFFTWLKKSLEYFTTFFAVFGKFEIIFRPT